MRELNKKASPVNYAQAILQIAAEPWLGDLKLFAQRVHQQEVLRLLNDPLVEPEKKQEAVRELAPGLPTKVLNFLFILAANGQIDLLDEVIAEYEHRISAKTVVKTATIKSAIPLSVEERENVCRFLIQRFGNDLDFQYVVDPAILGGLVIRVGDQVIDGSIASKLALLKERLS